MVVDEARWEWRGRRFAHLASDRSLEELHAFAESIALRRVAFHGDHYDIDETHREAAVRAGAEPVPARELVARLRQGGLRLPPHLRPGRWRPLLVARWPLEDQDLAVVGRHDPGLPRALADLKRRIVGRDGVTTVLTRGRSVAVLLRFVDGSGVGELPAGVRRTVDGDDLVLELLAG